MAETRTRKATGARSGPRGLVWVLAIMLAMVTVPAIASAQPVEGDPCPEPNGLNVWFLEEVEHPTLGAPYLLMCQGDHLDPTEGDAIEIDPGECRTWASNVAAAGDFTVSENGWFGNMDASETSLDGSDVYDARVGAYDPGAPPADPEDATDGSVFPVDGEVTWREDGSARDVGVFEGSVPSEPEGTTFTVVEGGFALYTLCNDGEPLLGLITDGSSWVSAPSDAPNFPIPELASVVLSVLGIAAIGLVAYRRNRLF